MTFVGVCVPVDVLVIFQELTFHISLVAPTRLALRALGIQPHN